MSLTSNRKSMFIALLGAVSVAVIIGYVVLIRSPKSEPEKTPTFQYVVLNRDIESGDVIKEEDVVVKDFPMEIDGAHKGLAEVIGRTAEERIEHDKPIMPVFLKPFVQAIEKEESEPELERGYSIFPLAIDKSSLPPFVAKGQRYDLYAQSGNFKIENLKIMDILDQPSNDDNKLLILEIKNSNIEGLIDKLHGSEGLVFAKRHDEEIGNYKYAINAAKNTKDSDNITRDSFSNEKLPTLPKTDETLNVYLEKEIQKAEEMNKNKQEVELIIGNQKTVMEFSE